MAEILNPDAVGSHLTTYELLLASYVLKSPAAAFSSLEDLAEIEVIHEPGFDSEHTSWPAETFVSYHLFGQQILKNGSRRKARRAHLVAPTSTDPVEFFKDLINGDF